MFRRVTFLIVAIISASTTRPAPAQKGNAVFQEMDRDRARGYTDKELVDEKRLLNDKTRAITWEWLPLIEYPRVRPLPASQQQSQTEPVVAKFSELPLSKIEADRKKFVETKLKGRKFSGIVRIARNEPNGDTFTIYANEPSRPDSDHIGVPGFATIWPPYLCQWRSNTDRDFHVGKDVDIVGKIEDLQEDGKSNTLFLKEVVIAPPPRRRAK